jgi:adenosylmethionine-8-amino-7-oxononanoate aminotransferase
MTMRTASARTDRRMLRIVAVGPVPRAPRDGPDARVVAAGAEATGPAAGDDVPATGGVPGVRDVRVKGAIGVVELERIDDLDGLRARFVGEGVFVRPFGSIIYLTPAFTIAEEELARLTGAVVKVVAALPR